MTNEFFLQLYGKCHTGFLAVWELNTRKTHWFDVKSLDDAARFALNIDGPVYFGIGIHARKSSEGRRGDESGIIAIPGLWVDVDAQEGHKKSNLPPLLSDAESVIRAFPFEPSILVCSGFGYHGYWLFPEPLYFDDDSDREQAKDLSKRFQAHILAIAQEKGPWVIDSTWDLSRILRVPGTMNKDRRVEIVHFSRLVYSPEDFNRVLRTPASPHVTSRAKSQGSLRIRFDANPPLEKWEALKLADPNAERSFRHDRPDLTDQSPSGYDFSLATRAAMAGWSDQEIVDLLIAHRRSHGCDFKREDYYRTTITKAKESARKCSYAQNLDLPIEEATMMNEEDKRKRLLSLLSDALKVELIRIYKVSCRGGPIYKLVTAQGTITIGNVSGLIEQTSFRKVIAAVSGHYITRFKPAAWDIIAQRLLDACETLEVSEDVTELGAIRSWVRSYLEQSPPAEEDEWQEAAVANLPFRRDGHVFISLLGLKRFVVNFIGENVSSKELVTDLRAAGSEPQVIGIRIDGTRSTTRSVWKVGFPI